MKTLQTLKFYSLLLLAVLLASCAAPTQLQLPQDSSVSSNVQAARTTITEAKTVITAAAQTIQQDVDNKVMTGAEAQKYLDELKKARDNVKAAEGLLTSDPLSAKSKAELANRLAVALQRELTAAAKGGSQ